LGFTVEVLEGLEVLWDSPWRYWRDWSSLGFTVEVLEGLEFFGIHRGGTGGIGVLWDSPWRYWRDWRFFGIHRGGTGGTGGSLGFTVEVLEGLEMPLGFTEPLGAVTVGAAARRRPDDSEGASVTACSTGHRLVWLTQ
jgi:hypothetical protein